MENQLRKLIKEAISLDIDIGDEIMTGRFKNKKTIVKSIDKDKDNQPTINGKTILKFKIRKLIKEEIDKLFEIQGFQTDSAEQMAQNIARFNLPIVGIHPSINDFNLIQTELDKEQSEEEKEEELNNKFKIPSLNTLGATTMTNIFEDVCNSMAAQDNLDTEMDPSPSTFGKEAQEEFDLHNDNIKRDLISVPPGNSRENGVSNNKSKNF